MATHANFDVADIYQEHGYLVRLTKGRSGKVQVFEVFGRPPGKQEAQWSPETILRLEAPREVWDEVSAESAPSSTVGSRRRASQLVAGARTIPRCSACWQGAFGAALVG